MRIRNESLVRLVADLRWWRSVSGCHPGIDEWVVVAAAQYTAGILFRLGARHGIDRVNRRCSRIFDVIRRTIFFALEKDMKNAKP